MQEGPHSKPVAKPAVPKPVSKLQIKTPAFVTLEKIIGHTIADKYGFTIHPKTGDLAYLAGSIICLINSKTLQIYKHLFNKSNRNFLSIAYSPNGDYLAVGEATCKQPEVLIYEPLAKDEPIQTLKGHKSGIKGVAFSADSQMLVTLGAEGDTRIVLWNWKEGRKIDAKKYKRKLYSVHFSPIEDTFITTGAQIIKYWIIEDNPETKQKTLVGKSADMGTRKDKVFADICASVEYTYALTEEPPILCIINKERKMEKWMDLKATKGFACKVSSKYIACACSDGIVRLFDPQTLQHIVTLPKPPPLGCANIQEGANPNKVAAEKRTYADTIGVEIDEGNNLVIAVYSDRSIIVWDIKNLAKICIKRSLMSHSAPINDVQILQNSTAAITHFVTCATDSTLRFWHYAESGLPSGAKRNAYSRDMNQILYSSTDHSHFKLHAMQQSFVNSIFAELLHSFFDRPRRTNEKS
jgi:WD40 repeat protein